MKKLLTGIFMLLCACVASAQDPVHFSLTRTGSFVSQDGTGFVVVPFEGKTTAELYNMVKNNIMSVYKDPKKVMSENENQTISVRGYGSIVYKTVTFIPRVFEGHYTIVFKFKDGRIRVDAPVVDDDLVESDGNLPSISLSSYCKNLFDKKGRPIGGKANSKKIARVENAINHPVNLILGLEKTNVTSTASDEDDNW